MHIVITPRSSAHFWQRLPPFRRTFDATVFPTIVFWLALQFSSKVPVVLGRVLHLRLPFVDGPSTVPTYDADDAWKVLIVLLVTIISSFCLLIPAQTVLVRVQASLLPECDDTIVSFDRSFGGAVTPAVVDGKGYATLGDAWRSFSTASWRRLLGLYVKIFFINLAATLAMALVIAPQVYVVIRHSTLKEPSH